MHYCTLYSLHILFKSLNICNYSALEKSGKLKHSIDMKKHPDLTALTETEKDALIIALYGVIDE
ncbi:MAG: hypothetical protein QX203_16720, partial [Methylococcaceae bacterium]